MENLSGQHLSLFRESLKSFIIFTDDEWCIFSGHLYGKTLKKKAFFAQAGKVCNEVGFIVEGSVRYYHVKDGVEITGYFSFENDFISAYKSFLTGTATLSYIEALENTRLIIFSKDGLQKLLADERINHKIERFGRLLAEHYLICYEDRVTSFIIQSAEERYLQLLKDNRNIFKRIPQHYIANYLGITAVSLSRIRKRIMEPASKITTS